VLPVALLLVQALLVYQALAERGRLAPIRVADTASYLKLAQVSSVDGALARYRTYGYPLLLKTVGRAPLPAFELRLFLAASVAFFAAVWSFSGSAWVGLAAASPLLYADALRLLGRTQPDFVACAFVLFAVAALLALVVRPRQPVLWLVLALAVFAAYQTRPATLFLIAWLPVVGWCLAALREGEWRLRWRWLGALLVATWVPYLLFAGFRAARVGEFGLVAFGGYNMSGLAASLIDDEMLTELDPADVPMARGILTHRRKLGWEPYSPRQGSGAWFEQYSPNIWKISVQAAKTRLDLEGTMSRPPGERPASLHLAVNQQLRDFSLQVIRRRPVKYLAWVRDANLHGWRQLAEVPLVVWPGLLLAVCGLVWWIGSRRSLLPPAVSRRPLLATASGLGLLAGTFFGANILLISLLSVPFGRYVFGATLLLPSALCGALAALGLEVAQRFMTASTSGGRVGGEAA
jgi:hypothetical protein